MTVDLIEVLYQTNINLLYLKKKIFYIENVYADTKINDYSEAYDSVLKKFEQYENYENIKLPDKFTFVSNKNLIKSNTTKKKFKALVCKTPSRWL